MGLTLRSYGTCDTFLDHRRKEVRKQLAESTYDIPAVNEMITAGKGGAGRAIRRWFRQDRIAGATQRTKNAKIWFNPEGVHEAWRLWASHMRLDPTTDMPDAVRKVVEETGVAGPMVTLIVPSGTTVKVIQAA